MSLNAWIAAVGFILAAFCAEAQQTGNPLELKRRQEAPVPANDTRNADTAREVRNPFERVAPRLDPQRTPTGKSNPWFSWVREKNIYRITEAEIKTLLFWGLLFLSTMLAIALNLNRSITVKLYRSLVNVNFLSLLFRETREDARLIYYLLYGLYFVGMSLFLYLVVLHYYGIRAPVYLLHIVGFVLAAYFFRHLSLKLLGYIFGISAYTERYLFSIVVFCCMFAVILIPANFIITFVSYELAEKCIVLVTLLFGVLFFYRQMRELIFHNALWRSNPFHFLLYLCTFELAPPVLMFTYLNRQGVF
ncbi:MAG: DUF4271 domain-containing protein [Saprospiraceae bacterium]|jgi:hypothetical protein|nr:DUF4271 domain-containing protein [Saprospiraceae bacterium]MBP9208768.1 DUF4271 domain-containing protein [Saprospiraceae bacterium]